MKAARMTSLCWVYFLLLWVGDTIAHQKLDGTPALHKYCYSRESQALPTNCLDYLCEGAIESRVYKIYPNGLPYDDVQVYCDQETDGGGWLVFQRRMDGSVNFLREWESYKLGFGDKNGEFWLGNNLIHELSSAGNQELRIDMEAVDGDVAYAKYDQFSILPESENYKLNVGGYSGTAGDAFTGGKNPANEMEFSTKDKDHDTWSLNCAAQFTGAWWYRACHESNLNGQYLNGPTDKRAQGVVWYWFKGHFNSLKSSDMKMRPSMQMD